MEHATVNLLYLNSWWLKIAISISLLFVELVKSDPDMTYVGISANFKKIHETNNIIETITSVMN